MCLAVPSKIIEINDAMAKVKVEGLARDASLILLEDVSLGDYVIVHAGFAISKVDEEAALQTIAELPRSWKWVRIHPDFFQVKS